MREYKLQTEAGVDYTLLLSDEDAERHGLLTKPENKKAPAPENKKVVETNNETESDEDDKVVKKTTRRPGAATLKK